MQPPIRLHAAARLAARMPPALNTAPTFSQLLCGAPAARHGTCPTFSAHFLQVVEPALAIMVPLLERGLRERQTAIKRKTAIIIDNMCKLVEDPTAAAPFLPKLLPGLEKLAADISDPEARKVCSKAQETLLLVRWRLFPPPTSTSVTACSNHCVVDARAPRGMPPQRGCLMLGRRTPAGCRWQGGSRQRAQAR